MAAEVPADRIAGRFAVVVDVETFLAEVARCSLLAILALAAGIVAGRLVVAWPWLLLVRSTHAEASFAQLARLTLMCTSLGFVGPGMIGTEAYRVSGLARTTGVGTALASVVVERLTSLAGIALVAIGLALGGKPMTNRLWLNPGSIGVPAAQAAALSLLFTGITAIVVFLLTLWFYFRFGIWGQAAPLSSDKPGS